MESMLATIQEIALRAIPTFLLVVFLYFYLRSMLFQPLESILARRRESTDGARQRAQEALDRAEAKVAEYEAALRNARGEVYGQVEIERKKWRDAQAARLTAEREKAMATIKEARARISADAEAARASLQAQASGLADQIVAQVLKGARG